jgi:hypothetical protein
LNKSRLFGRLLYFELVLAVKKSFFNTMVENAVEKWGYIFVSASLAIGSALCTGARAGTFVVGAPPSPGALPGRPL